MSGQLSRRTVLRLLGGAAAVTAVGVPLGQGLARSTDSTGVLLPSLLPLPQPFTRPLAVPRVLAPTRTDGTTDYYELTQRESVAELLPGVRTPIWGYDGTYPGPTIVSRSGRRTVVRHRNELPVPVVVHLHGGRTPPEHDGYPTDLLLPADGRTGAGAHHADPAAVETRGARDYAYPLDQRATTLWYHDHRMDFTGPSVWRGLAGFHLVHDDEEAALGLPAGDRDLPLLIADRAFEADGTLSYPALEPSLLGRPGVRPPFGPGVLGDVVVVNGVAWPQAEVAGARYRLRLLNASNARRYRLALDPPPPGGGGLVQVGTEGGLLDRPVPHDAIEIAPGQRYDVVVDFSRYRAGQLVTLTNGFGSGSTARVLRFRVGARVRDDSRLPARLAPTEPLDPARAAVVRDFSFRRGSVGGMDGWKVNGLPFDPARIDAAPRLGDVEVWRLISDFHHPVHLHLVHFRVLSRDRGAPGPYDAGLKDTLDLRPGEQAEIVTRFAGYRGRYLLHCHNLEHEDMAMMANFTIT